MVNKINQKDKRYKIFLVDDDTKHLVMLKNHLEKKSEYMLDIQIFSNGESCMEKLHEKPDIFILDYYLDGIKTDAANGLEIMKRILVKLPDAKIIMMSGQDNLQVAIDTIDHGAYDYIIKGESAYLRAQMILDHIIRNINMEKYFVDQGKKENYMIATIIILFALLIIFAILNRGFI
ncbi:MAG: response regulator [Bacteroidetes bacterium]|nr:response regulator [Bacteroidota bacterium]MBP7399340.1 response regulator [Chitinophagales bacterium]MBK7110492.1 response regulator [Bacteroidota bacterium]MBK8488282.1 response regulator [Bacteroidota bacterium]MBK8681956.1 response regulator [Bacteroidota bacterium]